MMCLPLVCSGVVPKNTWVLLQREDRVEAEQQQGQGCSVLPSRHLAYTVTEAQESLRMGGSTSPTPPAGYGITTRTYNDKTMRHS